MPETIIRIPLRLRACPARATPVTAAFDSAALFGSALPPGQTLDWRRLRLRCEPDGASLPVELRPLEEAPGRMELAFLAAAGVTDYRLEAPRVPGGTMIEQGWRQVGYARMAWSPEPGDRLDGGAVARVVAQYHYSPPAGKPFFHPLRGPGSQPLTRLGDPPDPQGRRHQHALWVGHRQIDGINFWDDSPGHGRQVHLGFQNLRDGAVSAGWTAVLRWDDPTGAEVLRETRRARLWDLGCGESAFDLELTFHAVGAPVRLQRTSFGLLGLRVANRLAPRNGGRIETSTGAVNEAEALHTRARWCDVSGPIRPDETNGIAVFDHDANPQHPCYWRVRDDGWIGAALCHEQEIGISEGNPLAVRYRILLHRGEAAEGALAERYELYLEPPEVCFEAAETTQAEA